MDVKRPNKFLECRNPQGGVSHLGGLGWVRTAPYTGGDCRPACPSPALVPHPLAPADRTVAPIRPSNKQGPEEPLEICTQNEYNEATNTTSLASQASTTLCVPF